MRHLHPHSGLVRQNVYVILMTTSARPETRHNLRRTSIMEQKFSTSTLRLVMYIFQGTDKAEELPHVLAPLPETNSIETLFTVILSSDIHDSSEYHQICWLRASSRCSGCGRGRCCSKRSCSGGGIRLVSEAVFPVL